MLRPLMDDSRSRSKNWVLKEETHPQMTQTGYGGAIAVIHLRKPPLRDFIRTDLRHLRMNPSCGATRSYRRDARGRSIGDVDVDLQRLLVLQQPHHLGVPVEPGDGVRQDAPGDARVRQLAVREGL